MGIKNDMQIRRLESEAGQLLETVDVLLSQEIENNLDIANIKARVKVEVAGDNFDVSDLTLLSQKLPMVPQIIAKKARYKTRLTVLRNRVANNDYKTEIQAVINTL